MAVRLSEANGNVPDEIHKCPLGIDKNPISAASRDGRLNILGQALLKKALANVVVYSARPLFFSL